MFARTPRHRYNPVAGAVSTPDSLQTLRLRSTAPHEANHAELIEHAHTFLPGSHPTRSTSSGQPGPSAREQALFIAAPIPCGARADHRCAARGHLRAPHGWPHRPASPGWNSPCHKHHGKPPTISGRWRGVRAQLAHIHSLEVGIKTLANRLSLPVGEKGTKRAPGGYRTRQERFQKRAATASAEGPAGAGVGRSRQGASTRR